MGSHTMVKCKMQCMFWTFSFLHNYFCSILPRHCFHFVRDNAYHFLRGLPSRPNSSFFLHKVMIGAFFLFLFFLKKIPPSDSYPYSSETT
ncbi:hypothetical protein B9Z19DRAFT_1086728 [Tuber borchii]|uniref:Uncharacterized protein n=1 Tax=Tuber borchii TaxID=42251 RepID=A0A2T6ZNV3_TUBBO|nr:hypothetical protein B9Z19DRAFT_1086728 [Tuber borchii]